MTNELSIAIVAGEHSGDALGAKLIDALNGQLPAVPVYSGVGGDQMAQRGFQSIFPLEDVAVMGPMSILPKLPRIVRRVYQTVDAIIAADPDVLVIIDSPEFSHPIAKRVRRKRPDIPIVNYVSPTVWAWRPGRAKKMKSYVDHLMALLPFEPEWHAKLGGPTCTYVGHPMIERLDWIRSRDAAALARRLNLATDDVPVLVLPGSRQSEVSRLLGVFGDAVHELAANGHNPVAMMPVVPDLQKEARERTSDWSVPVHLLRGEDDKFSAFRLARGALAASGTVTLELALAGTPMVVAYRVDGLARHLRFLVKAPSIVLANLVLGENAFPEFIQEDCTAANLSNALDNAIQDGSLREAQLAALSRIADRMVLPGGETPSGRAAGIVRANAKRRHA